MPSMHALCESGRFDILGLITNPLRYEKSGRPIMTPARLFAEEYGITVSEKTDIHSQEFYDFLWLMRPDLLFVCDFGHILSKNVLKCSLLGGINLHGSLLPRYRGAAPVHWAILNGDPFSGVTVIHMTPQVDGGPVISQSPPIPISPFETLEDVEARLAEYGADLVLHAVTEMATKDKVRVIKQLEGSVSKAPRFKKQDGLVDWNWSAYGLFNHYRAMSQWPKSFTDWVRPDGTTLRLILGLMIPLNDDLQEVIEGDDFNDPMFVPPMLVDAKFDNLAELKRQWSERSMMTEEGARERFHPTCRPDWWKPGTVIRAEGDDLIVAAGEGALRILKIQPAGKRMMDVKDFLLGNPIKPGDRFGIPADR